MAQSLKNKFNGNRQEVLDYVQKYGRFKAMLEYGVNDYGCFSSWVVDATKDQNFGLNPTLSSNRVPSIDDVIQAFIRKVVQLERENAELKEQMKFHSADKEEQEECWNVGANAVLEVCKT